MATQKGYIMIENSGEMDVNSLKLIGASSKRGDNTKIGFFGSGLKYALAVLMRHDVGIRIFSGENEIKLGTKSTKFRDQDFKVITVNGKDTSLTTDMGQNWKPWFAIREIYCNAIDEGNFKLGIAGEPKAEAGKTKFFIEFKDVLDDVFTKWNEYFSEKRTDMFYEFEKNKLFLNDRLPKFGEDTGSLLDITGNNKKGLIIYRKGIQVLFDEQERAIFHYDMQNIEINESRTIDSMWLFKYEVTKWLCRNASVEVVERIYKDIRNSFEATLEYESHSYVMGDNWLTALNGRTVVVEEVAGYFVEEMQGNEVVLPAKLAKALKKKFKNKVTVKGYSDDMGNERMIVEIKPEWKVRIDECLAILKKADLDIDEKIHVCKFKSKTFLGEAYNGEIYISEKVFTLGKRVLLETIIEEHAHVDSGSADKTRSFQNYLINMYINSIESKLNISI